LFNKRKQPREREILVAQMLDVDRKTVRKILQQINKKGVVEKKERTSILDPFKEFIEIQYQKNYQPKGHFKIFL
jgi:predicted transcriptional regulator